MADSLYRKLYDLDILRGAWYLAKNDTRTDFIFDSFKYNDFDFKLDENLKSIAIALRNGQYHPNPLIHIDVPKSTLAVRPGSVISIKDRIVLFAITMLIAPKLDKKLPDSVYSCRLKKNFDKESLFKDWEILKFPLLKGEIIHGYINIIEPWYGQWPKFLKSTIYTYEKEGYKFLTLSDISNYFENINLSILRNILLEYFQKEQKIINLLYFLLKYWTWPTTHGLSIERGIPQGNGVSNFLGNIYLLPLDKEFIKFKKKEDIRYFRYMDDVQIFSKEQRVARECIFVMNNILRKLHLNIQGTKTIILKGKEIRDELIDKRLDEVNNVIKEIQKNLKSITRGKRNKYLKRLKGQYKKIHKRNKINNKKDLRLYRRLITGFTLLNSSYMVDNILKQLPQNPDAKLLIKSVRYFRNFPRSWKKILNNLMTFLKSSINLFPYQESHIVELLRYLKEIPQESVSYTRKCLRSKSKHWYVKVQSALLLASLNLQERSLRSLNKLYKKEQSVELKRALVKCLCQLRKNDLVKFLRSLIFENDYKLSSLGIMLLSILYNQNNAAFKEISGIFKDFKEEVFLNSYYKIEILKYCKNQNIRKELLKKLKKVKKTIKRDHIRKKVSKTIKLLERRL